MKAYTLCPDRKCVHRVHTTCQYGGACPFGKDYPLTDGQIRPVDKSLEALVKDNLSIQHISERTGQSIFKLNQKLRLMYGTYDLPTIRRLLSKEEE